MEKKASIFLWYDKEAEEVAGVYAKIMLDTIPQGRRSAWYPKLRY